MMGLDWRRFRMPVIPFAVSIMTLGCGQPEKLRPIAVDCATALVARDSFRAELLEYYSDRNVIEVKAVIAPRDRVILSTIFHCDSGQLIYGTLRRMTASSKAELHFKGVDDEYVLDLDDGFNMIIPLTGDEVLVETAVVKHGVVDEGLGDISTDEGVRELPPRGGDQHYRIEALPVSGHRYLEDIVFDVETRKERRRLRGTLGKREVNSGKIISYATDQTISEFDPNTGRRTRIHDYRRDGSVGVATSIFPSSTYYFSINRALYAAVGRDGLGMSIHDSNKIYRFDQKSAEWSVVAVLDHQIGLAAVDAERIIAMGPSNISVYDTKKGVLSTSRIDFLSFEPTSLARLGENWALAVVHRPSDSRISQLGSEVWIVSGDFDKVLLRRPLKGSNSFALSSHATPMPPRGWR